MYNTINKFLFNSCASYLSGHNKRVGARRFTIKNLSEVIAINKEEWLYLYLNRIWFKILNVYCSHERQRWSLIKADVNKNLTCKDYYSTMYKLRVATKIKT